MSKLRKEEDKSCQGFTLIEVVVVMAIIAVLAALVVGAIRVASNTAKETTHRSNARTLEAGMQAYYAKHRTGPPANYFNGHISGYNFTQLANVLDVSLAPTKCDDINWPSGYEDHETKGGGRAWINDLSYGDYAGYYLIAPYMANCTEELPESDKIRGNMPYPTGSP